MNTLQFNKNQKGFLVLSDLVTGKLYYPADSIGNFINVEPRDFQSILFVSDGEELWPLDFISEKGLGWIASAINAVATIGSSIFGSSASKKANASAEAQLQTQLQIQQLASQTAERQAALQAQSNQNNGLSTPAKIGIGIAALGIVGTVIFLITKQDDSDETITEKES